MLAFEMAKNKRRFADIAEELGVATATAEVYTIDAFVSGVPLDFVFLCAELSLDRRLFQATKRELQENDLLKAVKENLEGQHYKVTYNQIRLVIAGLIRGEEL